MLKGGIIEMPRKDSSHLILHLLLGILELFQQCLGLILLLYQSVFLFCQLFKSLGSFARGLRGLKFAEKTSFS